MPRKPDVSIISKTYNNLKVEGITNEYNSYNRRLYECTCLLCGKKRMVTKQNLQKGEVKDCGNHRKYIDISGRKFGKLEALHVTDKKTNSTNRCRIWHCKCECGAECDVYYNDLINGRVKSCGCLHKEKVKELYAEGTAPCKLRQEKIRKTNTSGITGVWYDRSRNKWCAEIMFKKKKYFLGRYDDIKDAKVARKIAEDKIHGEFLEWYAENYPEQWEKIKRKEGRK